MICEEGGVVGFGFWGLTVCVCFVGVGGIVRDSLF